MGCLQVGATYYLSMMDGNFKVHASLMSLKLKSFDSKDKSIVNL